jgi:hypothetical protein
MLDIIPTDKCARAAALPLDPTLPPIKGALDVQWARPFDRLCYELAAPGLARKHRDRYDGFLLPLIAGTGCTEAELLTHGQKVRNMLFFAEDRLGRQGLLNRLGSQQQVKYDLSPVTMAF